MLRERVTRVPVARALERLARLFGERGGQLPPIEFQDRLSEIAAPDSFPLDEVSLLDTLHDLGVVWEAAPGIREPGIREMGIPRFADFVLRHAHPPKPGRLGGNAATGALCAASPPGPNRKG